MEYGQMRHTPGWRRCRGGLRHQHTIVLLAFLLVILAAGCRILPKYEKPKKVFAESYALLPRPDTDFEPIEAAILERHGPQKSGFLLIPKNEEALNWRLAMMDHAKYSLDLQYYTWNGDASGWLLIRHALEAANRGVRVRLLVDDLLVLGNEDEIASLNLHPSIETRIFNPWKYRDITGAGRAIEYGFNMDRLQYRMHDKLMVVDNQVALVGGRNIGDEYFGIRERFNFHDLDLLACGPVARRVSKTFDDYWNSGWAYPGLLMAEPSDETLDEFKQEAQRRVDTEPRLERFPRTRGDWSSRLNSLPEKLYPGVGHELYDKESSSENQQARAVFQMVPLFEPTESELLIASAYFIPNEEVIEYLKEMTAKGIRVRIITNSLGSYDAPILNSGYKKWRKEIIETGSELYEFRWDAALKPFVETQPVQGKFVSLHRKAMVVDNRHVYVGSLNFTPRGFELNTENGIVVEDCPELARELAELIEQDMAPENAWRVKLDEKGKLYWESSAGKVTSQPARSFGQRIADWFFSLLPLGKQL